jgi:hypothetical protein
VTFRSSESIPNPGKYAVRVQIINDESIVWPFIHVEDGLIEVDDVWLDDMDVLWAVGLEVLDI